MVTHITSRRNELLKETVRLVRSAEERRAQGLFVVEGARLCYDAFRSRIPVERLFYVSQAEQKYSEYLHPLQKWAKEVFTLEPHAAELLSATKTSQGVYAVCRLPALLPAEKAPVQGKYLAAENIQDPGNLGAMMRTGEALGISGLFLLGKCCDPFSPKVLRAGMGAVFRLPLYEAPVFSETASALHGQGFTTFAAVPDASAEKVTQCDFPQGSVLLVGNEGNGLLPETIRACSHCVTIPMAGRAESLNAASSSAILMWEMMRKQGGI